MVEFSNEYGYVTEDDVNIFRKKYKLPKLPKEYLHFLIKYNGGQSAYDTFSFKMGDHTESSIISYFFSVSNDDNNIDTMNYAMSYSDNYPRNMLPVACDYLGNTICLGIKGKNKNNVFIWIHDMVEEDDKWANMFLVADSFEEFFNSLKESGINESDQLTDLHEICKRGNYEGLKACIDKGVSAEDLTDMSSVCAYHGHIELLKLLAENGCHMKLLAYTSIQGGQTDAAIFLLRNFEDINEFLPDGSTWLHKAVEFDNLELVKFIINEGFDVSTKNSRGEAAIQRTQNQKIIELLKR